jgi:hypothetical protein
MLICANGFTYIILLLSSRLKPETVRLFCFAPIIFVFSFYEFPVKHVTSFFEEIKEYIGYLKENVNDDETIYVNRFIGFTFQYYQEIGLADFKVPVIIQSDNEPDYFENELKHIQGKCWLLFPSRDHGQEEEYTINRLDSIGYDKIKEYKTSHASIYLYNFK